MCYVASHWTFDRGLVNSASRPRRCTPAGLLLHGGARTRGGINTQNIDLELLGVFTLKIRFASAARPNAAVKRISGFCSWEFARIVLMLHVRLDP